MLANHFVRFGLLLIFVEQSVAAEPNRPVRRRTADEKSPVAPMVTVWETVYVAEGHKARASSSDAVRGTDTFTLASLPTPDAASATAVALSALSSKQESSPTKSSDSSWGTTLASVRKDDNGSVVGSPGKRGLAYNDAAMANMFGDFCASCSWGYNWASSPQGLKPGLRFVPMLWGDIPVHTSHWDADAERAISSGANAMFSFNEPDNPDQANMTPRVAAAAHIKYLNKYAGRVKIGAPSVTNSGGAGQGIQWLTSFMDACDGKCQVDFCNVHWYSQAEHWRTLFDQLRKAHEACRGKPIWLTEFAPLSGDTKDFLQNVIPKLESVEYLEGYSYFMVSVGSLISDASTLSALGKYYAGLSA